MRVVVLQYRSDIGPHRVQLQVTNGSGRALDVRTVVVSGSGYRPDLRSADPDGTRIGAGATVDLPSSLTTASCAAAMSLRGRVRLTDGTDLAVPVTDSHGTLAALRRADCFAEEVARVGTVAFADFDDGAARGRIDLRVTLRGAASLAVRRVLATTLLSPVGATDWAVDRRFSRAGDLTLTATPTRCDAHAVAEDKVGTVLSVAVALPDGRSGTVTAVAPPTVRSRVLAWVVRTCGAG